MARPSFLFSALRREIVQQTEGDLFVTRHPHPWLVWESATFRVPPKTAMRTMKLANFNPEKDRSSAKDLRAFELGAAEGTVSLGREESCDVQLNDGTVSGKHVELFAKDGGWWVRPVDGRAFKLDGLEQTAEAALKSGQHLELGGVVVTFLDSPALFSRLTAPST
ncbi:MAG: FHA domain-containing protein [Myxococcaceae bacterium]